MQDDDFKGITASQMAKIAKKTRQQISNYRKQGMPSVKHGHYYYYKLDAIQWLYDNGILTLSDNAPIEKNKDKKTITPRQRKILANAKMSEFELKIKKGEVIPSDKVHRRSAELGIFIRETLSAIPHSVTVVLPYSNKTRHYLKQMLKIQIDLTLWEISRCFEPMTEEERIKRAEKDYREANHLTPDANIWDIPKFENTNIY